SAAGGASATAPPPPRRDPVVLQLRARLDRARVDEADQVDLVVGPDRDLILRAVQEQEIAAHFEAVDVRPHAAELEAAHAAKPARVVPPERQRALAGPLAPVRFPGSRRGYPAGSRVPSARPCVLGHANPDAEGAHR